ncbi:MAG: type 4a pilus biogenesis protein PilO [Pasteurella sp.]|nr:type 4a pilus biogenesis protein PilO [Pasteurella sp.]
MARKNNVDVNDLSTWPVVMSLLFSLLIAIGIFYFIKTFLVDDISATISRKNNQIVQLENQYKKDRAIVAILPQIRQEVEKLKVIQAELKTYLPTKVSMPSLVDNVYLVGRNNGIVFDKLVPEKYIEEKYYSIKPISLKTQIGFESMAAFIEEVTTLKRIMNIDSVSFQVTDSDALLHKNANAPLTMTAQLRTYVFKNTLSNQEK